MMTTDARLELEPSDPHHVAVAQRVRPARHAVEQAAVDAPGVAAAMTWHDMGTTWHDMA